MTRDKSKGEKADGASSVEPSVTPETLRLLVRRIESEFLPSIHDLLDRPMPNVYGDLQDFPRPSSEDQAIVEGVEVLRDVSQKAIVILTTLAVALERKQPVNDAFIQIIKPIIVAATKK